MRRYIFLVFCCCVSMTALSQRMSVRVPSKVSVGEMFRLEYSVSDAIVGGTPRLESLPDGIDVAYGPAVSKQESYTTVNGHVTHNAATTFTYTLQASKPGTYTIPGARLSEGGKTWNAEAVRITVTGAAKPSKGAVTFHGEDEGGGNRLPQEGTPTNNSVFFKVNASKTHVHEQEPVVLTYKAYHLPGTPVTLEGKMPDVTGFQVQEVDVHDKNPRMEVVNGRQYETLTWSQYVIYPQMTGKLEIPSVTYKGTMAQMVRNVDPMEAFFNGGSSYVEVPCEIEAPGLTIQVDSLPSKPADFSGGVGKFNISAQMDKEEVRAGDPVTLRVVVGGVGNLKLLKKPEVKFPKDFDKYDPKMTDKTILSSNGVEGNMIYDFLAVPRNQGDFVIPPVKMVFYDTSTNSYKTIQTDSFRLKVLEGDGTSSVNDFTDERDKDIRAIKEGKASVHPVNDVFFGSRAYWIWIAVPMLVFAALMVAFRKRAIDNANIGKMRGKKANKVATRRLRDANKLMLNGQNDQFYDEVLKALWGYVGDKLNMPVEQLSRENVSDKLSEHGVDEANVEKFIQALDECEFERYAPGDSQGNMSRTFEAAMTAIMKIEETMKSSKLTKKGHSAIVLLMLLVPVCASAVTKENADNEYKKGDYQQAIKDYTELLKAGESATLYYNLGNAYYRSDDIPHAILNYEKAYLLSPGDEDIRFNLELTRSKTIDKINPRTEMFFITWYHALVNFTSVNGWAVTAIVAIIMMLALVLIYLFSEKVVWRKWGFYGAVALLAVFLLANLFAYQQMKRLENRNGAVIMSATVNVKKTPDNNADNAFVLHEGTKVEIKDKSIKGWREVQVADGRIGWLPENRMEEI